MRHILVCILVLISSFTAKAAEPAMVRAYAVPESGLFSGQLFTLYLEVKVETWLLKAPDFPEVNISKAFSVRPEQLGTSISEVIDGKTYSGVRMRYLIVALNPGELEIPSVSLTFTYAGENRSSVETTLETEPFVMQLTVPPGLRSVEGVAVVKDLRLLQEFSPPLEGLKVGDAFTHKVTLKADGSMGFILPEHRFEPIDGFDMYRSNPRYDDSITRGEDDGQRSDSATYILQEDGSYTLPEIRVQWFDLDDGVIKEEVLPPTAFDVVVNPNIESSTILNEERSVANSIFEMLIAAVNWVVRYSLEIGSTLFAIAILRWFNRKYGSEVWETVSQRYSSLIQSEVWAYERLLIACLFMSKVQIKIRLRLWVSFKGNDRFKQSVSWTLLVSNYGKTPQGRLSRLRLLSELIVFSFKGGGGDKRGSSLKLNP